MTESSTSESGIPEIVPATTEIVPATTVALPLQESATQTGLIVVVVIFGALLLVVICICIVAIRVPG